MNNNILEEIINQEVKEDFCPKPLQKFVIPTEFKIGFCRRKESYGGLLGFLIYMNKPDGTYRLGDSLNQWADENIPIRIIENKSQSGFFFNKELLREKICKKHTKFRVAHPEGFEFEIGLDNMTLLLCNVDISSGEIKTPCRIGWKGHKCYLIPDVNMKSVALIKILDIDAVKKKIAKKKVIE